MPLPIDEVVDADVIEQVRRETVTVFDVIVGAP
jgi:hypothetical protein